jgi:hypothetical protein
MALIPDFDVDEASTAPGPKSRPYCHQAPATNRPRLTPSYKNEFKPLGIDKQLIQNSRVPKKEISFFTFQ